MRPSFQILLNYGKYYRIWPYFDINRNKLYVSVGLLRPFVKPICKLLLSGDLGQSWEQVADFHSIDKRNTTTGQPFVTKTGTVFVPVWNAGFYTHGKTWLAIYRSEDAGASWKKVYEDSKGTYGKHFFQDAESKILFLGVGVGGGGHAGKVTSTPGRSHLLKSLDSGETWNVALQVNYPTALYSGTASENNTIIITAREKKSVFTSVDTGISWTEKSLGNTARSASYFKELGKFVVSSNSSVFVSNDGFSWNRINTPIKWLILRYPTLLKGRIFFAGVVGRSLILSTDLEKWYINFDATKVTGSNLFTRIAAADDCFFLGNELNGILLKIETQLDYILPMSISQLVSTNAKSLISLVRFKAQSLLTRNVLML